MNWSECKIYWCTIIATSKDIEAVRNNLSDFISKMILSIQIQIRVVKT